MRSILALHAAIKAGKSASATAAIDSPNSPEINSTEAQSNPAPGESKLVSDVVQSRPFRAATENGTTKAAPQDTGRTSGASPLSSEVPPAAVTEANTAASASTAADASGNDYELVLGRRQIASCLFAGILLIAIFASASYFAGKMSTPSCAAASSLPAGVPLPASIPMPASVRADAALIPLAKPVPARDAAPAPTAAPAPAAAAANAAAKPNGPFLTTATNANTYVPNTVVPETKNSADQVLAGDGLNPLASTEAAPLFANPLFASPKSGALYLQMGALDRNASAIVVQGLRERGYHSFVAPGPSEKIYRVLIGPLASQEEYKRIKSETATIDVNVLVHEALTKRGVAHGN